MEYDIGKFTAGLILGVFLGVVLMMGIITKCDGVEPFSMDSTKIRLIKMGHGEWEVNPDGTTRFVLKNCPEPPQARQQD